MNQSDDSLNDKNESTNQTTDCMTMKDLFPDGFDSESRMRQFNLIIKHMYVIEIIKYNCLEYSVDSEARPKDIHFIGNVQLMMQIQS